MGSGIAEVCARAGLDVVVREVDAGAAEAGLARADDVARPGRALRQADRGRPRRRRSARIRVTTDLDELADRQLVVEAVVEDEAAEGRRVPGARQGRHRRRRRSWPATPARSRS